MAWFNRLRGIGERAAPTRRLAKWRPMVEVLEDRRLLSCTAQTLPWTLDSGFCYPDGTQTAGHSAPTEFKGEARALALQSTGKIILAGSYQGGGSDTVLGIQDLALVRLNADGTLDTNFDTDGIKVLDFDGTGNSE